jgi:hypothetical protein
MFKCGSKKCNVGDYVMVGHLLKSYFEGTTFHINHCRDCNSGGVVYLVNCKTCNMQNVGCSIAVHKKLTCVKLIYTHRNKCEHTGSSDSL